MGFKTGWVCVRGLDKAAVLERLGLEESEETGSWMDFDWSGGEMPDGWTVIVTPYGELPSRGQLEALSAAGEVLTCELHETVMCSMAQGFREGRLLWTLEHDVQSKGHDKYHLAAMGELPPSFAEIRDRLLAEQKAADAENQKVDYIFDGPAELVFALCGFRADGADIPNEPEMTLLEPAGRSPAAPSPSGKSFFARLFGGR